MIWQENNNNKIYQGNIPLINLSPLERNLLLYFLKNPGVNLTKSQLIENSWPEDVNREGVSDDSLFRLISSLRTKLGESDSSSHKYIINWRGSPEGGYRFLPSGEEMDSTAVFEPNTPHDIVNQLTMLQRIISNQKQTIILLEEIVDGFVESSS